MVKRYYHYYDGNDANDGTSALYPRKLLPGQTGAVAVSAGDEIEARAGVDFSGGGRLVVPANNLTYRAYGIADNVLEINLPHRLAPWIGRRTRVVREAGVHEGMWILDGTAVDADGMVNSSTRTGTVIEDLKLLGSQIGTRHAMTLASSSANVSGFTLRRFEIVGAAGRGIAANTKDVLIEWGRITHTQDDNVGLVSTASNLYRAGSVDTLRYLELVEPNKITLGASDTGTGGDHFQCQPSAGLWDGSLTAHTIWCTKTTAAKQASVLHATNANSRIRVWNVRVGGGGDSQFLIGHVKGQVYFDDIFADEWAVETIPLFRFDQAEVSPPAYAMDTGSLLRIRNVIARGSRCPGFYSAVSSAAASFDGIVEIDNCSVEGLNDNTLSYASTVALWSGSSLSTFGANFRLRLRNNALRARGKPQIILPTGWQADARVTIAGNSVCDDAPFEAGTTEYATLAEFEAAVSGAASNRDDDPMTAASGTPMPGSPLLNGGIDLGPRRDIRGFQSRKNIGALSTANLMKAG